LKLPHRFPFRWVECRAGGVARAAVSANSTWQRGDTPIPAAFLAELVAQAAAVLLADPEEREPRQRWLAGIEKLEMHRTLHAGDLLEIAVAPGRRFGNAIRVEGSITAAGLAVAEVVLLLV
jgi:predicted hotdog family 3-hydroxylacyl-ACP dehydratase